MRFGFPPLTSAGLGPDPCGALEVLAGGVSATYERPQVNLLGAGQFRLPGQRTVGDEEAVTAPAGV